MKISDAIPKDVPCSFCQKKIQVGDNILVIIEKEAEMGFINNEKALFLNKKGPIYISYSHRACMPSRSLSKQ